MNTDIDVSLSEVQDHCAAAAIRTATATAA
jgi:hypothetical protein